MRQSQDYLGRVKLHASDAQAGFGRVFDRLLSASEGIHGGYTGQQRVHRVTNGKRVGRTTRKDGPRGSFGEVSERTETQDPIISVTVSVNAKRQCRVSLVVSVCQYQYWCRGRPLPICLVSSRGTVLQASSSRPRKWLLGDP